MNEIWVPVYGSYRYEVSNLGRIRSNRRRNNPKPVILKPYTLRNGYQRVQIYKNGIRHKKTVHRLVCEHFHPNLENKPYVNHIDGDKNNNKADNLEWVTPSENSLHASRSGLKKSKRGSENHFAKLSEDDVKAIRGRYKKGGISQKQLGKEYGVSQSQIARIISRKEWGYVR